MASVHTGLQLQPTWLLRSVVACHTVQHGVVLTECVAAQAWRALTRVGRGKAARALLAVQHWHGCCSRVALGRWWQACEAATRAGDRAAGHYRMTSRSGATAQAPSAPMTLS